MKSNEKLKKYIPLVDFISSACGNAFEVVLHDTKNPKQSVVAIKNGHLSGRKIGDAMTDLAINLVNTNEHMRKHFISNYEGRLKNGKIFLSATYFIKEENELIGLLCINYDPSIMMELNRQINNLLDAFNLLPQNDKSPYTETLDSSINNITESIISSTISNMPVSPSRTTSEEKIEVISALEKQGFFSTKGAVSQVSNALNISEPTVYRYLKKIRND